MTAADWDVWPPGTTRPTAIADLTREQLLHAEKCEQRFYFEESPGRFALALLESMKGMQPHGVPINIYRHLLQAATLSLRDGASEEMVVVALLHDIGAAFGADNHARVSAEILRPFVSDESFWILEHHALFQEAFYAERLGLPHRRHEQFKSHPFYASTMHFVDCWDQAAFDPDFKELPLSVFEPLVRRVFARRPGWRESAADSP